MVCSEYSYCAHLTSPDLNQYCTVEGQGHSTEGWQAFLGRALEATFWTNQRDIPEGHETGISFLTP